MRIYLKLLDHFGFMDWWPGDTKFEILVGAILTQNTRWSNVELAIGRIKEGGAMSLEGIAGIPVRKLEVMVRPSGYYRQKAARLKLICSAILDIGGLDHLFSLEPEELRDVLLGMNGIGRETADSIMLYAAEVPTFVVDAYTIREMSRILGTEEMEYSRLKSMLEGSAARDVELYKDIHAQFVELGKNYCRKTGPLCKECPLNSMCSYSSGLRDARVAKR